MKGDAVRDRLREWFLGTDARAVTRTEVAEMFGISLGFATRVLSILRYEKVITMKRGRGAKVLYRRAED